MAPPNNNYFELFGLPVGFDIDVADLSSRYRRLARESHPDRFAGGSDAERRLAVQTTTLLNEAFRALKDPVSRARHVLEVNDVQWPAGTVAAVAPEFLVQQMELRERLDDLGADHVGLEQLAGDVGALLREKEKTLSAQLAPSTWHPREAMLTVQEMQFLDKLLHQIHDRQEIN